MSIRKFGMKLKNDLKTQIIFFVSCEVIILTLYFITVNCIKVEKIFAQEISDNKNIVANIDSDYSDDRIVIFGTILDTESEVDKLQILLQAKDGSDEYMHKVSLKEGIQGNKNIMEYEFSLNIKLNKLRNDVCYEIFAIVSSKDDVIKIPVRKYLYGQEIYAYDPLEFSTPKIEDAFINKVVTDGRVCTYDLENGMYVYEYEDCLYWIFSSTCKYIDSNLYVPYHIATYDVEHLPEERKQYGYDNRDFVFGEQEMVIDDANYRVAVRKIPTGYVQTYVTTGIYLYDMGQWVSCKTFISNIKQEK